MNFLKKNKKLSIIGIVSSILLIVCCVVYISVYSDKSDLKCKKDKKISAGITIKSSQKKKNYKGNSMSPSIAPSISPTVTPVQKKTMPTPANIKQVVVQSKSAAQTEGKVSSQNTVINENGKTVIIDAGHGGSEPGAVSTVTDINGSSQQYKEKDINLSIAKKLNSILNSQGIKTYMIRTGDSYIDYKQRPNIANSVSGAALYVSIHCNSQSDTAINGTETYYYNNFMSGNTSTKEFASVLQSSLAGSLNTKNNGVFNNQAFTVIVKTVNMLSILTEVGYMSNKDDMAKLITESYKDLAARAIANSVSSTLIKLTPQVVNPTPNISVNQPINTPLTTNTEPPIINTPAVIPTTILPSQSPESVVTSTP